MHYELTSVGPSGNGGDLLLKVYRRPNWWDRLLRRSSGPTAYYGPHPQWVTMEGYLASQHMQHVLDELCKRQRADGPPRGATSWKMLEPRGENDHDKLAGPAGAMPTNPEQLIANATGELAKPRIGGGAEGRIKSEG